MCGEMKAVRNTLRVEARFTVAEKLIPVAVRVVEVVLVVVAVIKAAVSSLALLLIVVLAVVAEKVVAVVKAFVKTVSDSNKSKRSNCHYGNSCSSSTGRCGLFTVGLKVIGVVVAVVLVLWVQKELEAVVVAAEEGEVVAVVVVGGVRARSGRSSSFSCLSSCCLLPKKGPTELLLSIQSAHHCVSQGNHCPTKYQHQKRTTRTEELHNHSSHPPFGSALCVCPLPPKEQLHVYFYRRV